MSARERVIVTAPLKNFKFFWSIPEHLKVGELLKEEITYDFGENDIFKKVHLFEQ